MNDKLKQGDLNLEVVFVAPDKDSDDDGDVVAELPDGTRCLELYTILTIAS